MKPLVVFIVGPTAVGKSEIASQLAQKFSGEIISADSMLVYRDMNIGTAKPTLAEQRAIPHHLIDIIKPSQTFSVFQYYKKARRLISQIVKRGKVPVVVGGTGLYIRAILQGLEPLPPADMKLRKRLQLQAGTSGGLKRLYDRLKKYCPERAAKIKPTDERRIIRALEVWAQRKKLSAARGASKKLSDLGYSPIVIGISCDRGRLYSDVDKRVETMFERGLVEEVRNLLTGKLSMTASQAVGYKEIIAALKGEYSLDKAKELIKRNTRHLAKRQWTWFRREEGIQWVERSEGESLESQYNQVLSLVQSALGVGNSI